MTDHPDLQWNNDEIAHRLKSAMDTLTPDVFDKIDLKTPQEYYQETPKITRLYRRARTFAAVAAACLCVALLGGGVSAYQNSRVESFIGIDVNPSIELSVNRKDKVLKAEALNEDGTEILEDMELKNVDLNIAVNAVIGSMVRHGYLDEVENAILVTVSNDDREKAAALRQDVVGDIENSLEEHKLSAVVYDQQLDVTDEVEHIAAEYGISYGKAYFLQELVEENNLSGEDLKIFAGMTMEEISREIAERSYNVRKDEIVDPKPSSSEPEESVKKTTKEPALTTEAADTPDAPTDTSAESTQEKSSSAAQPSQTQTEPVTTAPAESTAAESEDGNTTSGNGKKARIDYVDYYGGVLNVVFKDKVKWKNPTISVKDEDGESYSAKITDTGSDSCEIEVRGLPGGVKCTFSLGGVAIREGGGYGTVKGYFDAPDIADDITEGGDEPDTPETTTTAAQESAGTAAPETSAQEPETTEPEASALSQTEEKPAEPADDSRESE